MKQTAEKEHIEETLPEKATRAVGTALLVCFGLILFFMIFLAFFMKGVISGWF